MVVFILLFLLDNVFNVMSIGDHRNNAGDLAMRTWPGQHINIEDVPYIVSVHPEFHRQNVMHRVCTGFFIHSDWVMTAAHCFDGSVSTMPFVRFGSANYSDVVNQVKSSQLVKHPKYNPRTGSYDTALLKVRILPELAEIYQPLKLDEVVFQWASGEGKRSCIAIGFGSNTHGDTLLHANIYTVGYDGRACGCVDNMPHYLCGTIDGALDVCFNDGGGPLVCDGWGVGVANKLIECGQNNNDICGKDTHYRYTYICPQLRWIKNYVDIYSRCEGFLGERTSSTCHVGPVSFVILVFTFIDSIF